jgi:hypothetical protein
LRSVSVFTDDSWENEEIAEMSDKEITKILFMAYVIGFETGTKIGKGLNLEIPGFKFNKLLTC